MSDIEKCIRKEGFVPVREDAYVRFKVSGEPVDVFYVEGKLSLVVNSVTGDIIVSSLRRRARRPKKPVLHVLMNQRCSRRGFSCGTRLLAANSISYTIFQFRT
jgi:hypothetical protein